MNPTEIQKHLNQFDHDVITEKLAPFITDNRKARIESVITYRLDSISLAIESPSDLNNALAAIRTCEALGISTIHIISAERDASFIHGVTMGAFYWVTILFYKTLNEFLTQIKCENKLLAGAIINAESNLSDIPIQQPLCLLMGNEQRGLSIEAKSACDFLFSIPMCGMTESFNLSVAAAISLFDLSQRKRVALKNKTDLTNNSIKTMRAQFYLQSVSPRLIKNLLKSNTN